MMVWTVHELAVGPGLGIPVPTLGCPCRQPGQVKYTGAGSRGAWHLPSLLIGAMLGALWLLLGRGEVVFSAVCLAEFMATSAASPASCDSRTVVSSRCRCPTGSRPGVSTYS